MTEVKKNEAGATQNGQRIYSHEQVLAKVPMCARTILNMEKRGEFPRRFRVSPRRVGWDADEVETWIAARKQERQQAAAPGAQAAS